MNILRLAGSDNAGCRCHHLPQHQQLLLQQCLIFGDLDHHQRRGIGSGASASCKRIPPASSPFSAKLARVARSLM